MLLLRLPSVIVLLVAVALPHLQATLPAQETPPVAVQQALNRIAADLFSSTPRTAQAIEELRTILTEHPGLAEAHMLLGIAYRAEGTPEMLGDAVGELRQAVTLKPELLMARLGLARVYMDMARHTRAKEELDAALEQAPRRPEILSLLGEVERQLGDAERAAELNRQALAADGEFVQARYYLGLALLDLRQHKDAIAELEAVAASGQNPGEALLALGTAYMDAGRPDAGVKALERAVQVDPSRPEARIQLARAYRVTNRLDAALEQLAQAMPGGADTLGVLYRNVESEVLIEKGLIRMQQGRPAEAAEAFERVLALDETHEVAKQQLAAARRQMKGKAAPKPPGRTP